MTENIFLVSRKQTPSTSPTKQRDEVVDEKTKASQDTCEISTTSSVVDSLTLYSTSANAAVVNATTCQKRDRSALQGVSNSSCSTDR